VAAFIEVIMVLFP